MIWALPWEQIFITKEVLQFRSKKKKDEQQFNTRPRI